MSDTMKCPFREKDGEYCDCYGKACMAYYEFPSSVCSPDSEPMKMCRKIMSQYLPNFIQTQYPTFNPYSNYNFYSQGISKT